MLRYPLAVFAFSVAIFWLAGCLGTVLRKRRPLAEDEREDFGFLQAGSLTLLGLIIGFSFSMAVGRFDQRKALEEAEANAIGTEYVRAGLMPISDASTVRQLLNDYLNLRIASYTARNYDELNLIQADTDRLQGQLWLAVQAPAKAQPTPLMALALSGMNDVLNAQGYTQAACCKEVFLIAEVVRIA